MLAARSSASRPVGQWHRVCLGLIDDHDSVSRADVEPLPHERHVRPGLDVVVRYDPPEEPVLEDASVRGRRIREARTRRRARDERHTSSTQDRPACDVLLTARERVGGEHVLVRAQLHRDRRGDLRVELGVGFDRLQLRALERARNTRDRPARIPVGQKDATPVPLVESGASGRAGVRARKRDGRKLAVRSRRARDARRVGCRDRRSDGARGGHGRNRDDDGFLHRHALLGFPPH